MAQNDRTNSSGKNAEILLDDAPVDVSREVNFIWSIANKLRGTYKAEKYKDVIIPMTIIRRFECALAPTKAAVVERFAAEPDLPYKMMCKFSGFQFYNTSRFTLKELLNDSAHIADNFRSYIKGFSQNVREIIANLEFDTEITKMDTANRLFGVVDAFSELDLNPDTIDNIKMGYIFEELIRKFSENAEAGDHYTGRDIIKLMVSVLLAEGCDDVYQKGKGITVLDQACGTGGMLSTSFNFIKRLNPDADIHLFGQEINPESYAMCLAEMLIKGQNIEHIRLKDTRLEDCFSDQKMRFVIENPPFGTAWGGKDAPDGVEAAVRAEHRKGFYGRWGAGLPSVSDMQLLFIQSAIDKLNDDGRAAIIENGSPLFTGDTASGESQIRRWLLQQDLLEAVIALPTDLFYNTGIATYIWILSKNKREERKGKVQLINAVDMCVKLRKSLGKKRNEISPDDRNAITKLYADFTENERCKIFSNEDFMYREYTVMRPLRLNFAITAERLENMRENNALKDLYNPEKVRELEAVLNVGGRISANAECTLKKFRKNKPVYDAIFARLAECAADDVYMSSEVFTPILAEKLGDISVTKGTFKSIMRGLSEKDENAEIQRNDRGDTIWDEDTKDPEYLDMYEDIDEYMKREVLPFHPDAKAFWEHNPNAKKPVIRIGAEIPFTRHFYSFSELPPSDELEARIIELDGRARAGFDRLFGGGE